MDNIMMIRKKTIIINFLFRSFHSNKTNINNIRVRVPSRGEEGRGKGRGGDREKKRKTLFFIIVCFFTCSYNESFYAQNAIIIRG